MDKDNVKVVILAGGFGTRLKEETEFKPKPLVSVGERPILWHIMKIYSQYGFNNFIVALGYKGDMIKEYFLNYHAFSNDICVDLATNSVTYLKEGEEKFRVTLVDTGLNTMTGARIRKLKPYIGDSRFMVTYGDGVADVNIGQLYEYHLSHGKVATITGVRPSSRFGELNIEDNLVTDFKEKPQVTGSYINGGFFVFEPTFFEYLEGDDSLTLEQEPLINVSAARELAIYKHDGFWKCMDTHKDFKELNRIWREHAPWKVWD